MTAPVATLTRKCFCPVLLVTRSRSGTGLKSTPSAAGRLQAGVRRRAVGRVGQQGDRRRHGTGADVHRPDPGRAMAVGRQHVEVAGRRSQVRAVHRVAAVQHRRRQERAGGRGVEGHEAGRRLGGDGVDDARGRGRTRGREGAEHEHSGKPQREPHAGDANGPVAPVRHDRSGRLPSVRERGATMPDPLSLPSDTDRRRPAGARSRGPHGGRSRRDGGLSLRPPRHARAAPRARRRGPGRGAGRGAAEPRARRRPPRSAVRWSG